ncbi:MAG: hypothetical protein HGA22_08265, partial [Clostridiales bacterium]|nr:hypothetical protein [Clostridiales bacterium]
MKKRLLCMLLATFLILSLMPTTVLAAGTVTVSDFDSLNSALKTSATGTTVKLGGDISFYISILTPVSLILDLNGHTLTYTGTDAEQKTLKRGIFFTGS